MHRLKLVAFTLLYIIAAYNINSAHTVLSHINFKVRTSSPGGNFSPKNIGAIWIEDSTSHFVKTL